MRVYECVQGGPDWLRLRTAIPTASQFHRVFQPIRRKPSEQRHLYLLELVDEMIHGVRDEPYQNAWTRRGQELEPVARFSYEMEHGRRVRQVGFCTRDDGLVGGSPDGLVGDDGILEIKVKSPQIHATYLDGKEPNHIAQCQGLLWVCERAWTDLWLYSDTGESVLKRIDRDDDYLAAFVPVLDEFLADLEAEKSRVRVAHGVAL